jgi:hypothetical protein
MKKILAILIIIVCSSNMVIANETNKPKIDTLAYLKSIVANKANYVGRPFSALLNDLQIQIRFFSPFGGIFQDKSKETSTMFSFYFPQSADEMYLTFPCLRIAWSPYLNADISDGLYKKYNGGGWQQEVIGFYSSAIIADIIVIE